MNTKRIMRWVIVLFLLAALPGMTAVMAQGQEPAGKAPLPVVTEPGESAAPAAFNKYESEPNNTFGTADPMVVRDVMGGEIGSSGDVDYFVYPLPDPGQHGYYLIDIEAASIGSSLDPVVCVYDNAGNQMACNDDTDTVDSLVFITLWGGDAPYYIEVTDYWGDGGSSYDYELILSSPILVSAAAAGLGTGNVAGIPFQSQDILAHSDLNTGGQKWVLFFDGSDVGITKNIWNVAQGYVNTPGLYIGLAANQNLPGVGTVTPWDIIEFMPGKYGPDTQGTFAMYLDGSAWGLTTSGEKVDAFSSWAYGTNQTCFGHPLSTAGAATVVRNGVTMKFADEDIPCMEQYFVLLGWKYYFDGSLVNGLGAEDVYATAVRDNANGPHLMYITILGGGKIGGNKVTQKDIFAVNYPAYTWNSLVWHGPDHGWNYNIDAFEYKGW